MLCQGLARIRAELQSKQNRDWEERMSTNAKVMPIVKLESPRFEDRRPLRIAGLAGRYTASFALLSLAVHYDV